MVYAARHRIPIFISNFYLKEQYKTSHKAFPNLRVILNNKTTSIMECQSCRNSDTAPVIITVGHQCPSRRHSSGLTGNVWLWRPIHLFCIPALSSETDCISFSQLTLLRPIWMLPLRLHSSCGSATARPQSLSPSHLVSRLTGSVRPHALTAAGRWVIRVKAVLELTSKDAHPLPLLIDSFYIITEFFHVLTVLE